MSDQGEFIRSLENATSKMIKECMKNMETACLLMERSAKKKVNVDQGTLRASITHDVVLENGMIVGSIFSNLNYAPYVEKGTGVFAVDGDGRKTPWNWKNEGSSKWRGRKQWQGSRPHPFLEPAREENKDKISKILAGKSK